MPSLLTLNHFLVDILRQNELGMILKENLKDIPYDKISNKIQE